MRRGRITKIVIVTGYFRFLISSLTARFDTGEEIGHNFVSFSLAILKILPGASVLIGFFKV
ncbi:MAG: hypothetical protein QF906_04965 [Dehalococcoidales bacterium]|jgi:hypothetical protein|nr:hypothetical protein [Dehalococcoidales bacterium]MDP7416182.1 hypothetical protein [Dehalococcoidales bacterium]